MNKPLTLDELKEELGGEEVIIYNITQSILSDVRVGHRAVYFKQTGNNPNLDITKLNHYQAEKLRTLGYTVEYNKFVEEYTVSGWV